MTMTQTQIRYAMLRVEETKRQLLAELEKPEPPEPPKGWDIIRAIKENKFWSREGADPVNMRTHDDLDDFFTFIPASAETEHEQAMEAYRGRRRAIEAEAQRIGDQLVLGDATEALSMIEAFKGFGR